MDTNRIKCNKCKVFYETSKFKKKRNGDLYKHCIHCTEKRWAYCKNKIFECKDCGYRCSANSSLVKHIKRIHDRIKDFKCSQCSYKCSTNDHLKRHRKRCNGKFTCSKAERQVIDVLNGLKIDYYFDRSNPIFTDIYSKRLRFDFYLPDYDLYIECDGKQHFKPIKYYGGIDGLRKTQDHDYLKNVFCGDRLLRIPYFEKTHYRTLILKHLLKNQI